MNKLRAYLVLPLALFALAAAALAADPNGTWKWTTSTPNGQSFDQTLTLHYKDGALTGTVSTPRGDSAISDATFANDTVQFSVVHERNGHKRVVKYQGKLEGDAIKGTVEMTGRDGEARSREWNPHRAS